ncbi:MAG: L-lactate dehydrogenase [Candidatus Cyclobacteriaceae bacterium M2_1C_046]
MNYQNAIGIIGMGWVGASVAISILNQGICQELLVNDINPSISEGEAMDLNHGSSFYPTAKVSSVSIEEMIHCRAIVITAGRGGKPNETRLDLLKENIKIVKDISEKLHGYKGILIIVANPVDVLTYYYQKYTGLPVHRVIGTGTMLDTARLREFIGRKINVDPKSIHANVIGEHGESEVTIWSRAMAGGISLRSWKDWKQEYEQEISSKVRYAAQEIIKRKGATNHAIGLVTATLLKWITRNERRFVNISSVVQGHYGLNDVALSLPSVISENGISEVYEIALDDKEQARLYHSADILRKAIDSVK